MFYSLAVIYKSSVYHGRFTGGGKILIADSETADLRIPGLGREITVVPGDGRYDVSVASASRTQNMQAFPDKPLRPDENAKLAIMISQDSLAETGIAIPLNGTFRFGRGTGASPEGTRNDLIIKKTFVSRFHFSLVRKNGETVLYDNDSTNGVFVNGERVTEAKLRMGDVISVYTFRMRFEGNVLTVLNDAENWELSGKGLSVCAGNEDKTVIIERSPRLRPFCPAEVITLPSPPAKIDKPQFDFLSTFLPAIVTILVGVSMALFMNGTSMLLYSVPTSLSGVIISVVNIRKQKQKYEKDVRSGDERFKEDIAAAEEKLSAYADRQLTAMNANDPDTPACILKAAGLENDLWNRKPTDGDFLTVRIGTGDAPCTAELRDEMGSGAGLSEHVKKLGELKDKYAFVHGAPVCCALAENHITGVVGRPEDTRNFLQNLLIHLATHDCYTDLKIVYLYSDPAMAWAADLPHTIGCCASGKDEAGEVLKNVIAALQERERAVDKKDSYGKAPVFSSHFLFVIEDPSLLPKNRTTEQYVFESQRLGVSVVMAVEELYQLPEQSRYTVVMKGCEGELIANENASARKKFVTERLSTDEVSRFAASLKNIRCREEKQAGGNAAEAGTIPSKYSFFEMLGVNSASEIDLAARWAAADTKNGFKAPIGIGLTGLVYMDMNEDGPHGLVAGTTGSGKSEMIVSYLLALVTLFSPEDLALIVIDFKGGALCNKFRGLPHVVGTITNLAESEIQRSLKAIQAELKRRQMLLDEASQNVDTHDIDNINKYTRLYKAGRVKEPMPHLLFVVDEFAELKSQYPDALDQLVSAARIGRSLGVHLILATQKPAGQVSDQIASNSRFRICLKVQTEQDSNEMIKVPLAAKIKEAGRAYLMVGAGERLDLFQSGYSGTPDKTVQRKETDLDELTQLNTTINHIIAYCKEHGIEKQPDVFMENLPETIPCLACEAPGDIYGTVGIGLADDPAHKRQEEYDVSLLKGNLMIIGSAQSGKTNLLQLIIRRLAEQYTPEEVEIYILDFGTMFLKKYETLNHVGGVVTQSEDEKLKHLFQLLNQEADRRRKKFLAAGVSSLSAYREHGGKDVSHIVVIVDNMTALKSLYLEENDMLLPLCQSGLTLGINIIIANSQTQGISFKYLTNFDTRIALYCSDSMEYSTLFDHCRETVDKIPGRCLVKDDQDILTCQLYLPFEGESETDRTEGIAVFLEEMEAKYGSRRAKQIPALPERLSEKQLFALSSEAYARPYFISLGLDYETVGPVYRDMRQSGCLSLSGGSPKVQSAYIAGLLRQLNTAYPGKTRAFIVDGMDRSLQSVSGLDNVSEYTNIAGKTPEIVLQLEQTLKGRMALAELGGLDELESAELLILVINAATAADTMNQNRSALAAFGNLITTYRDLGVCVLVSGVPNASYMSSEFYKKCFENRQFVWFDNLAALKMVSVPYAVTKKYAKKVADGDAFLFNDTECTKLQIPVMTE